MSDTKKPTFNADAAEEYFSDLLVYYRNTANDIFNRDNDGRHASNHIYSAEYQKYVGMQIAMREVLEYFSKYDLEDWQEILGENYDLARLRELVEADREGRCVMLPCKVGDTVFQINQTDVFEIGIKKLVYDCGQVAFDETAIGVSIFTDREAAEAALKKEE